MGGLFFIEMKFNSDYPEKGPIDVQMRTPTYHPNIFYQTGHILVLIIVEGISIYSSSKSSSFNSFFSIKSLATLLTNLLYGSNDFLVLIIVEGISIYSSSGSSSLHFIYRIFLKIIIIH